jgi:hypothetical protein
VRPCQKNPKADDGLFFLDELSFGIPYLLFEENELGYLDNCATTISNGIPLLLKITEFLANQVPQQTRGGKALMFEKETSETQYFHASSTDFPCQRKI